MNQVIIETLNYPDNTALREQILNEGLVDLFKKASTTKIARLKRAVVDLKTSVEKFDAKSVAKALNFLPKVDIKTLEAGLMNRYKNFKPVSEYSRKVLDNSLEGLSSKVARFASIAITTKAITDSDPKQRAKVETEKLVKFVRKRTEMRINTAVDVETILVFSIMLGLLYLVARILLSLKGVAEFVMASGVGQTVGSLVTAGGGVPFIILLVIFLIMALKK